MDKEFEEWLSSLDVAMPAYTDAYLKLAWNASKQYWLDKAVEVASNLDVGRLWRISTT